MTTAPAPSDITDTTLERISKASPLAFVILACATLLYLDKIEATMGTMATKESLNAVSDVQSVKIDNIAKGQERLELKIEKMSLMDPRIAKLEAMVSELQRTSTRHEE